MGMGNIRSPKLFRPAGGSILLTIIQPHIISQYSVEPKQCNDFLLITEAPAIDI